MALKETRRVHVVVSGRVQGVAFRYSALDAARSLHVKGWVKNLYTGEVEALVEGNSQDVEKMVEWLKKGPPLARVTRIAVHEGTPSEEEFTDFQIVF